MNTIEDPFRSFIVDYVGANNTLPIEQSFCKINDDMYAQLERRHQPMMKLDNSFIIAPKGIIDHISLDTFPMGQYTLSINDNTVSTAYYNPARECSEFDLNGNISSMLNTLMKTYQNRKYLDCRDKKILIFYPWTIPEGIYTFSMHGYFPESFGSDKMVEKIIQKKIYPHRMYRPLLNQLTESLDIYIKIKSEHPSIILEIDGYEVIKYEKQCSPTFNGIRVQFKNPDHICEDVRNSHLPEIINQNTINTSCISSIIISTVNCEVMQCASTSFMIYHYPSREMGEPIVPP